MLPIPISAIPDLAHFANFNKYEKPIMCVKGVWKLWLKKCRST